MRTPGTTRRDLLIAPAVWAALAALRPATLFAGDFAAPTLESGARRLIQAATDGDLDAVRRLLDRDPALLAARDAAGRSAFAVALLAGHHPVAGLLRQRGHEPDLHEAALALDWDRFEALAEASPGAVDRAHPVAGSAMAAAALGGAGSSIFHVYAAGGEPNARPCGAPTALRAALDHPDLGTAEMTAASLLANGAAADAAQPDGDSALHVAARRGSRDLVEMLARKGASVAARDAAGRRPVDLAEHAGHAAVAALLRRHAEIPRDHSTSRRAFDASGAPYEPPDLSHLDPAQVRRMVGVAHFDLDEVKALLGRHPELVHAVATTTEGAVESCSHTGRRPIVDLLLDHGAPYPLPTAVMRGDLERARELLDEDPLRIHERGPHDFALLWYPVIGGGRLDLAKLLLDRGAEIERQHYLGTTALHYAAFAGQVEMAALLIDRGADLERVGRKFDPAGQTPLELARARGQEEMAAFLEARGGRVSA